MLKINMAEMREILSLESGSCTAILQGPYLEFGRGNEKRMERRGERGRKGREMEGRDVIESCSGSRV